MFNEGNIKSGHSYFALYANKQLLCYKLNL